MPGSRVRSRSIKRNGGRWGRYAAGSGLIRVASVNVNGEIGTLWGGCQVQPPLTRCEGEEESGQGQPPHGQGTAGDRGQIQPRYRRQPVEERPGAAGRAGKGDD